MAQVSLPNGLKTHYDQQIIFKDHLSAQADIITENRNLIDVFFRELRKISQ